MTGTYAHGRQIAAPVHDSAQFATRWGTWFKVLPSADPNSPRAVALVNRIRTMRGPFTVLVTGLTAQQVDTVSSVSAHLPLALAVMALVTFLALFLMTGSLVIPAKALVLSAASLSATFGVAVWVFQQGHLSGLLGFTPSGYLDVSTLLLMFCLAFGLSMDYQVFLLSRIREEFDLCGDTTAAVAMGLERTGRIVTTAAALLAIVFIALGTSSVGLLKLLGGGIAVALILDATLIRALLLPALMRLLGSFNWWAPAPLRRLHARIGFSESAGPSPSVTGPQPSASGAVPASGLPAPAARRRPRTAGRTAPRRPGPSEAADAAARAGHREPGRHRRAAQHHGQGRRPRRPRHPAGPASRPSRTPPPAPGCRSPPPARRTPWPRAPGARIPRPARGTRTPTTRGTPRAATPRRRRE